MAAELIAVCVCAIRYADRAAADGPALVRGQPAVRRQRAGVRSAPSHQDAGRQL